MGTRHTFVLCTCRGPVPRPETTDERAKFTKRLKCRQGCQSSAKLRTSCWSVPATRPEQCKVAHKLLVECFFDPPRSFSMRSYSACVTASLAVYSLAWTCTF